VAFTIGQHKRNKPRRYFPLGNDDELYTFAPNPGFGPANQLMGTFGGYEDESKLAINTLWNFHCLSPSVILPGLLIGPPESNVEILWFGCPCVNHDESTLENAKASELWVNGLNQDCEF
jgi:hypothetical protein